MELTIEADRYAAVGPVTDMYSHGPVTVMTFGDGSRETEEFMAVCLDCGYVASDARKLFHVECDRADNPINQTWRERLDDEGYPDGFGRHPK